MPTGQLFIALGFTLFGAMLALAIALLITNRRLRREAGNSGRHAPESQGDIDRVVARTIVEPAPQQAPARESDADAARLAGAIAGETGALRDAVDPELFPVFEEEAAELLQRLATDLRRWMQNPGETAPRASMLGALQMLKGSARVAGAMQLGERAQRMEADIEALGRGIVAPAGFHKLLARLDAMQGDFSSLRAARKAVQADDAPAPDAPPPAVRVPLETQVQVGGTTGQDSTFTFVLPLTTAVTHVVMLRAGEVSIGVSSGLIEVVQYVGAADLERAYRRHVHMYRGEDIPFYWAGALLKGHARSGRGVGESNTVVVVHSASQRVALHVDEVLGHRQIVVENLGPQLSRLPGMGGISVLASDTVALICNPVALISVHRESARQLDKAPAAAPALRAAAPAVAAPAAPPPDAAVPGQVPLVLVVDDSITVRLVAQRLLQREGYRVSLAVDGLQALSRLQEERPAVVLSDIEMPRMDGFDLARNIRADGALSGLPIIMITSRIAEKHREQARQIGVNHYLGKPYAEEELMKLVRLYTSAALAEASG